MIYGAIATLLLARFVAGIRRAKRSARAATRIFDGLVDELGYPRPELREAADVGVPFTIGFRDPVIVLPKNWRQWDEFKLRSVLAHELAHIRRNDWATSLVAAVNRAVFWYHPLAWWLEKRLAVLSEDACDGQAIRSVGDASRYARVVLDFAEAASRTHFAGATAMARTSNVGRRIDGIIHGRTVQSRAIPGFARILMLAAALPVVYGAAAFQLVGQAQAPAIIKSAPSPYSAMSPIAATQAILADGWKVTPAEAEKLESALQRDPENVSARIRLLSYYTQYIIFPERRTTHLLWLIEHHPDSDVFQINTVVTSIVPDYSGMNTADVERARTLWLHQAERFPTNPRVLANAGAALGVSDFPIRLELVKRARALEPDNPEWVTWLGAIYERAVRSSLSGGRISVSTSTGRDPKVWAWPAFTLSLAESDLLKNELEISTDTELVGETGETLLRETSRLKNATWGADEIQASEAFGKRLLGRAHELDPANPRWKN